MFALPLYKHSAAGTMQCCMAVNKSQVKTHQKYCFLCLQASTSVQHLVLPCHWTQRSTIVADMIKSHGCAGRSIVFTDTKKDANELTASLSENCGAMALHGDIPQVRIASHLSLLSQLLAIFPIHKLIHVHKAQSCSSAAFGCLLTLHVLMASAQTAWQANSNVS